MININQLTLEERKYYEKKICDLRKQICCNCKHMSFQTQSDKLKPFCDKDMKFISKPLNETCSQCNIRTQKKIDEIQLKLNTL